MRIISTLLLLAALASATPSFEENHGQAGSRVRFLASTSTASVLFTRTGVEFLGLDPAGRLETLRFALAGSSALDWQASGQRPETYHYILPGHSSTTPGGVHRFDRLRASNVYPGIDLLFYFADGKLEYDFIVKPGADASRIRIQLDAPQPLHLSPAGEFQSKVGRHDWRQRTPLVYQDNAGHRREVASHWRPLGNHQFQFVAGHYNTGLPLVVDPVVEFASYLGGEADDEITIIGEGFVAGNTSSNLFDGLNTIPRRGRDVFIRTQSTPNINSVVMVNWRDQVFIFGGSGDESLAGATVLFSQTNLNISFGGTTSSRDIPFPNGPVYKGGDSDAFMAQYLVNSNSTQTGQPAFSFAGNYYGGSGADRVNSMLLGGQTAYFAGTTDSKDLPVSRAVQSTPGGGRDAFYSYVSISPLQAPFISSYFGGAGDDEAHVLRFGPDNILYLAGETRSDSVPLLPGSLAGPSDGFLLEFGPSFTTNNLPPPDQNLFRRALRFGGSGEDRLKFVSVNATNFILAGETTSTDLPLVDAIQANPAGGVDLFLLNLNAEREVVKATYWGGSGDDYVRAGATTASGELLIAGDTTSTNLPLREPVQNTNKGGRDGYYAYFSRTGALSYASYYGGAGEDFIHAALLPVSGPLRLAGATTSTDLVAVKAWQPTSAGGVEGFVAEISLPEFIVGDLAWAARGTLSYLTIRSSQPLGTTLITATIGDPTLAQFRLGDQRMSEISWGILTALVIEGLAESGETTITLSAPGFASRQIRLRLGRTVMNIISPPSRISAFLRSVDLRSRLDILDTERNELVPASSTFINQPFNFPSTWTSSDPSVLRVGGVLSGTVSMVPVAVGTARISVESIYPFWPEGGLPVEVEPGRLTGSLASVQRANPLTRNTIFFQPVSIPFSNQFFSITGKFRVTSEDPSQLLLVRGANDFVSELDYDLVGRGGLEIPVRPLSSSSSARIRVSSPQLAEDAVATVELTPLLLEARIGQLFENSSANLEALANTQTSLVGALRFEGGNLVNSTNIDGVITLSIASSNPAVARPASTTWTLGQVASDRVPIAVLGQGSAEIRVSSNSPHLKVLANPAIKVVDKLPALFTARPILVGHRLQTTSQTFLSLNFNGQVEAELIVDDPSLVLIASSQNAAPVPSFRFNPFSIVSFVINGMAASGSTSIRLRIPNYEDVVYPVKLGPSGFSFADDRRSVDIANRTFNVSLSAWVLDVNTLEPIEPQVLQPGITARLSFASNSADLTLSRTTCELSSRVVCQFVATTNAPGEFAVSLAPVDDFPTPSGRQRLSVRVLKTALTNITFYAVKDCLVTASIQTPFSFMFNVQPLSLRITSLDPDKILFSTAADQPGQESVSFLSNQPPFIHGMGGTGFARYRLEGAAIDTLESTMPVYNWTLGFVRQSSNFELPVNTAIRGTTSGYNLTLLSTAGQGTVGTRPGIPVISYEVEISDAAILTYRQTGSEKTFPPGTGFRQGEVTAVGVGTATMAPAAGAVRAPSIELNVRLPRLTGNSLLMAPNARLSASVRTEPGATPPTDNTLFTIRSLDPSRLLVQRPDSGAPGVASISGLWPANASGSSFAVDSLAADGEAEFEVTLPGFEPFVGKAYFATPALKFLNSESGIPTLSIGMETSYGIGMGYLPRPELAGRGDISTMDPMVFRPGFDPSSIAVEIETDNPNILTQLTPAPLLGNFNEQRPLRMRAVAAGITTVRLVAPPGFGTLADSFSARTVRVQLPEIAVNCSTAVAYESMTICSLPTSGTPRFTIRSASPGRLLISGSETATGVPELQVTSLPNSSAIYLHGLASNGSTAVTFSAPGYQDRTLNIQHLNSAFVFNNNSINPIAVNGTATVEVIFVSVGSDGRPNQQLFQGLRPGAVPVVVPIRAADATVVGVSPATVTFNRGERSKPFELRGLKSGSTSVELGTPAGFAPPLPAAILVRVN